MTTLRCTVCGTETEIHVAKDAYGIANGTSETIYRTPGETVWTKEEPSCKWPVAALFEPEKDTRDRKVVPHGAIYLGLNPMNLEVARCLVDCPDGKRREMKVWVDTVKLLDWAIRNASRSSGRINDEFGNQIAIFNRVELEK